MSRPTYAISREIGAIAVFIGRLLQGLFISLGRKARTDGIPKIVQIVYWLKRQTFFLLRKLNEVGIPKVLEAGQISKGLIILATRNLKAKGVPMVVWIAQSTSDLSSLFYKKTKIIVGEKVNVIKQDIAIEQTTASGASATQLSPEIILKKEETIKLNERFACLSNTKHAYSTFFHHCKYILDIAGCKNSLTSYFTQVSL